MKRIVTLVIPWVVAGAALMLVLLLVVWFFLRIPTDGTTLALDWISIRPGVANWTLTYETENGLRIPPWSAALLLPLGQIPTGAGWGVVAFLTLAAFPLTLVKERGLGTKRIAGVVILSLSYPAVRTIVDGNVEFMILAGMVLLEFGLARKNPILFGLGILLAATKVQETWILLIFLPRLMRKEWSLRAALAAAGVIALVGIPAMIWKGWDWLQSVFTSQYRGSIMDSSMLTTVQRAGAASGLAYLLWMIILALTVVCSAKFIRGSSRDAFGFLLAASLLLAPYAAGNNLLIVYAIGVMPLLLSRRWEGVVLAGLINLPYCLLPFRELQYWYSASYWTLVLVSAWILFALRLWRSTFELSTQGDTARRPAVA